MITNFSCLWFLLHEHTKDTWMENNYMRLMFTHWNRNIWNLSLSFISAASNLSVSLLSHFGTIYGNDHDLIAIFPKFYVWATWGLIRFAPLGAGAVRVCVFFLLEVVGVKLGKLLFPSCPLSVCLESYGTVSNFFNE